MPENQGNTDTGSQREVISERTDEAAEEQFIKESQINDLRDKMVADFDTGFSNWGDDTSFKKTFQSALNTLIQNEVSKLVNVNNLSTLEPEKMEAIKAAVTARMEAFQKVLESNIGYVRDVSDVADTKKSFSDVFSYEEFFPQADYGEVEGKNDAIISMGLKGTLSDPKVLSFSYLESDVEPNKRDGEMIRMNIMTNEEFFKNKKKTTPGSLADKVGRNRDIYLVDNVNYRIEDPQKFQTFLQEGLKAQGLDLKTLSEEQGLKAAVEIVRANLKDAGAEGNEKEYAKMMSNEDPHPSNAIPIDQLIMGKEFGVCRHYAAASRVVFEQIQAMAIEAENSNLADTVVFENYMASLGHGTLGIVRENSVTTMDPYWYAGDIAAKEKAEKEGKIVNVEPTMDSTFDGKHGNVGSLYQTLSRVPLDRPEDKIFDIGNISQVVTYLKDVKGSDEEVRDEAGEEDVDGALKKLDSYEQGLLTMANGVLENKNLHNVTNLESMAKNMLLIANRVRSRDQESAITHVFVEGIKNISVGLSTIVEEKIQINIEATRDATPDEKKHLEEELSKLRYSRSLLGIAHRAVSGEPINSQDDETSGMSEDTKEIFNFEKTVILYEDVRSKVKVAQFSKPKGNSLEVNLKLVKNSTQEFVEFFLNNAMKDMDKEKVRSAVGQYVTKLESDLKRPWVTGMPVNYKTIPEAVLPILKPLVA